MHGATVKITVVSFQTTSGGMENQDSSSSTAWTKGQFRKFYRVVGPKTQEERMTGEEKREGSYEIRE